MEIEFCVTAGCAEIAIGTRRSRKHCRRHYLELAAPELVLCDVIGQFPIASPDGTDVNPGGQVALDPMETDIKALVYCGHVRVVPQKAAAKTAKE